MNSFIILEEVMHVCIMKQIRKHLTLSKKQWTNIKSIVILAQQDAYIYATTEKYARKIEKEAEAYEKIGIEGGLVDSIPFDIDIQNALVMKNQAQFHPTKYLVHLLQLITEKGGLIFENTTAVNIETGEQPVVLTREETPHHRQTCSCLLSFSVL